VYELGKREIDVIAKVIKEGQLFRYRGGEGGWCDRFEKNFAAKIGTKYALSLSSGTGALICALIAAGIEPGDEVIVPAYTFMATPLAVLAVGAIPIIAEVDETLSLDPKSVEANLSRYTRAIVPVHMSGRPCDMNALKRIARKRNLLIVEDACQAAGGSYHGKRLGSIGDAGGFSFNQFKIIGAGEGGAMVTSDLTGYDKALIHHDGGCVFRKHADKVSTPFFAGTNFRVSEITGAMLCEQLKQLDGILKRLRSRQAAMRAELAAATAFQLSPCNEEVGDCGVSVPILLETPKAAREFLARCGQATPFWMGSPINTGRHVYVNWDPILKKHGAFHRKVDPYRHARRKVSYSKGMCKRSLEILARTVNLVVPYEMPVKDVRQAAKSLARA
jgi:dTDP-4-amino-4,6-dideoxygalactose transaminase